LPQSAAEEMQWKPARLSGRAAARGDSKKPSMVASGGDLAAAGAMGAMGGRFVATGA